MGPQCKNANMAEKMYFFSWVKQDRLFSQRGSTKSFLMQSPILKNILYKYINIYKLNKVQLCP